MPKFEDMVEGFVRTGNIEQLARLAIEEHRIAISAERLVNVNSGWVQVEVQQCERCMLLTDEPGADESCPLANSDAGETEHVWGKDKFHVSRFKGKGAK